MFTGGTRSAQKRRVCCPWTNTWEDNSCSSHWKSHSLYLGVLESTAQRVKSITGSRSAREGQLGTFQDVMQNITCTTEWGSHTTCVDCKMLFIFCWSFFGTCPGCSTVHLRQEPETQNRKSVVQHRGLTWAGQFLHPDHYWFLLRIPFPHEAWLDEHYWSTQIPRPPPQTAEITQHFYNTENSLPLAVGVNMSKGFFVWRAATMNGLNIKINWKTTISGKVLN